MALLRARPGRVSRADLLVAAAALVVVAGGTVLASRAQSEARDLDGLAAGLMLLAAVPLGWRRLRPVEVLAVVVAAVAAYLMIGYPYGPVQLCMVFAMFEVARLRGLRTSLLACAGAVAVITAALLSRRHGLRPDEPLLLATVFASWLVVPWSVGALVHVRAAAARRTRRELLARGALEERMRVAQEVHDVAGHGFAAVAMQAGVALLVFEDQPTQAKESLEAIQQTSSQALADLRAMLDAFEHRREGLAELGTLVSGVQAAGLPVRLSLTTAAVPEAVGRAGYRIVQEALTNVLRHAGPATAQVQVQVEPDALVVRVLDDGAGVAEVREGRGLAGMRDRVEALGGSVSAGPRPGGGFQVLARLPYDGRLP